jgi:hypothetical protein
MLAKLSSELPTEGTGFVYEPKWDGFRALVWKSGDEVYIQSRDLRPLGRYFPELEASLRQNLPDRCVLDGEIVIATNGRLDFDALLLRIHPAASRIQLLTDQRRPGATSRWNRGKDLSWSRSGLAWCARSRSSTFRARGSATPPTSSAGAPTSRRASAATISSSRLPPTSSRRSSAAAMRGREVPRGAATQTDRAHSEAPRHAAQQCLTRLAAHRAGPNQYTS